MNDSHIALVCRARPFFAHRLNSKIQTIKKMAYSLEHFKTAIYFHC